MPPQEPAWCLLLLAVQGSCPPPGAAAAGAAANCCCRPLQVELQVAGEVLLLNACHLLALLLPACNCLALLWLLPPTPPWAPLLQSLLCH